MPEGPKVVVTFYDNFRFEPVDIHGVFASSFGTGTEARTGIFATKEGIKHEAVTSRYSSFKVHVVSGAGTWKIKIKLQGKEYESSPIPYNASAAEIAAALPSEIADPGEPPFEEVGEGAFAGTAEFVEVLDIGSQEWEFRLFEDSGAIFPSGASVLTTDIDLAEVIEMQPRWDEIPYVVRLTEGCGGIGPPPPGQIQPGESQRGTVPSRNPVTGHRA